MPRLDYLVMICHSLAPACRAPERNQQLLVQAVQLEDDNKSRDPSSVPRAMDASRGGAPCTAQPAPSMEPPAYCEPRPGSATVLLRGWSGVAGGASDASGSWALHGSLIRAAFQDECFTGGVGFFNLKTTEK